MRPRPFEPLLKEPWVPFTDAHYRIFTRTIGFVLVALLGLIIASCLKVYRLDKDTCTTFPNVNTVRGEHVHFKAGITFQDQPFIYRLLEYKLYTPRPKNETITGDVKDEIIVIFLPSEGTTPMAQQHLAKLVRDRSVDLSFRFIWYTIDFEQESTISNGYHFTNQYLYLSKVMEFLDRKHRSKKFVVIGYAYGGAIAHSLLSLKKMEKFRNMTSMIIFEGAQIKNPSYIVDRTVQHYYYHLDIMWQTKIDENIGLVTFSGGLRTSDAHHLSSRVRRAVHIPVWSVDGVPDSGVYQGQLATCCAFVEHVADLFIEYGKRHKEATGKEIVRKFFSDYEWAKIDKLPEVWNKDWLPDPITVATGETYRFTVDKTQWIEVKLERDEHIQMTITGACLKAAALIRNRKHIRRKDMKIGGMNITFGVYDAMLYEDVRMFLESDSACDVTIETSSSLWKYATRFNPAFNRDAHQLLLGALLTHMYLLILEGDSRSVRFKKQLEFYTFLIAAMVFHAFHGIGMSSVGLLIGAVGFTSAFLVASASQYLFLITCHRTLEGTIRYEIDEVHMFAVLGSFITLFSHNYGFLTAFYAFLFLNRIFMAIIGIFSLAPMMLRTFLSTYYYTVHYLLGPQIYSLLPVFSHFFLRCYGIRFSRNTMYGLSCTILIGQICYSHVAMDVHYVYDLCILVLLANTDRYTPYELQSKIVRPLVLEDEEEEADEAQANEAPSRCAIL